MIDWHTLGTVPRKHHTALRREPDADGCPVYYEHCITRKGFDGAYSILYRRNNPAAELEVDGAAGVDAFVAADDAPVRRRHFRAGELELGDDLWSGIRWLAGNDDLRIGSSRFGPSKTGLVQNGDGDLLLFMHDGDGTLDSEMGRLTFRRHDYVWIPKGVVHSLRFETQAHVMVMECTSGLEVPGNFRNPVGQLRFDAPYCHRDFRRPVELSAVDGEAVVLHKARDAWSRRRLVDHPFDVVGWDGTLYPVAFNIHDYQPKTGLVHLPPTIHTTFLGGRGAFVVCSFVPRKVDYHPAAIPCPYPHSSVDCDELLWYVDGDFTSRKGVGPASVSLHPAGIAHAPQPGRYEASIGSQRTDELAVMVDTFKPLRATAHALSCEDVDYHGSWASGGGEGDLIT